MFSLRTLAVRRAPISSIQYAQRAGIHSSPARYAGKESALNTEGRAEDIQKRKEDSLQKQKSGKPEWNEGLASESESIVKADRGEVEASDEIIKKLQEETKKVAGK